MTLHTPAEALAALQRLVTGAGRKSYPAQNSDDDVILADVLGEWEALRRIAELVPLERRAAVEGYVLPQRRHDPVDPRLEARLDVRSDDDPR